MAKLFASETAVRVADEARANPRRLWLHQGLSGGKILSRRQALHHRRRHQRNPAIGDRAAIAQERLLTIMMRGVVVLAAAMLASCGHRAPNQILLFTGAGTSSGDVAAIESLLDEMRLGFDTASSSRLNRMSEADLRKYNLLIVPGGNFMHMGEQL